MNPLNLKAVVLSACFSIVAWSSPALAQSFSPQPILRNYLVASLMLERCNHIKADQGLMARKNQVDQFGQFLINSLANRAVALSPSMSKASAAGQISQWMSQQGRAIGDQKLCSMASNKQLQAVMNSFAKPSVQQALRRYGARPDVGIRPTNLRSNRNVQTYALPKFQTVVEKTIATSHSKDICRTPEISSISVVSKHKKQTRNRPVFVQPAIHVIERWAFRCGRHIGQVDVTFSRDNDQMLGVYKVTNR